MNCFGDDLTGWQDAIQMICKGRHIGVDVPPFMRFVRMCLRTGMLVEYRHSARNIMRWVNEILCAGCVKCDAHRADFWGERMDALNGVRCAFTVRN